MNEIIPFAKWLIRKIIWILNPFNKKDKFFTYFFLGGYSLFGSIIMGMLEIMILYWICYILFLIFILLAVLTEAYKFYLEETREGKNEI